MKTFALMLIVALGITLGAFTSANADRWPADLLERLDREYS
jgi:hypothetical protein